MRLHVDEPAHESARAIDAVAYTVRSHVAFQKDAYSPNSLSGQRLLAHELAHVIQQGEVPHIFRKRAGRGADQAPAPKKSAVQGRSFQAKLHCEPARIDRSKTIDQITYQFYEIPIQLLPPNTSIPSGPILTIGRHGCDLRRYGLTSDDFTLTLENLDIQSGSHPFLSGSGLTTVECWARSARFRAELRQIIYLPNDAATHPCLQGQNARKFSEETLAHERLHEGDNVRAAQESIKSLLDALVFTPGIGRYMALVKISDDPKQAVTDLSGKIGETVDKLRSEVEVEYRKRSAEYASNLDPWDRELHMLKLRLLERARERASQSGM